MGTLLSALAGILLHLGTQDTLVPGRSVCVCVVGCRGFGAPSLNRQGRDGQDGGCRVTACLPGPLYFLESAAPCSLLFRAQAEAAAWWRGKLTGSDR